MTDSYQFMRRFNWLAVPAGDVRVGDMLANNATVTDVEHGFGEGGDDPFTDPPGGQVVIRCGESFASLGDIGRGIVVGRDYMPPENDDDATSDAV